MIRLMPFVRTGCVLIVLSARPVLAYDTLIEAHAAVTYHYVLGKGEVAGRSVLLAAAGVRDPSTTEATKAKVALEPRSVTASCAQGTNRLAQWPGCSGESAIVLPRGTH
jgi:hypothetical protein